MRPEGICLSASSIDSMRILFLCSSLEPGRDGVGDYTRLLAGECTRQGHPCAIIALNDSSVIEPMKSSCDAGTVKVPFLRLPASLTWKQRMPLAIDFRSGFQPDWISLQFVSYGFDNKGIVLNLNQVFRRLTFGCPLHLMLHELWIGDAVSSSLRHRLIGRIQRLGIMRMISLLKPHLVTTSNRVYLSTLKSLGIHASLLPLFGNISIAPMDSSLEWPIELADAGLPRDRQDRAHWWLGIFFGAIHPEWEPEPLMSILRRTAHHANKRICLLLAGRSGAAGNVIWEKLRDTYASDVVFVKFGEQSAEKISTLIQISNFGIATSPWQLIGKSSAAATMLDHGLPVIVTRDDFQPRLAPLEPPSTDPLLHRCDASLESKLVDGLAKRAARSRLGEMAAQLCRQLEATANAPS